MAALSVLSQALAALDGATFAAQLGTFWPPLTRLLGVDYATADVQRALSELMLRHVGPLLAASQPGSS